MSIFGNILNKIFHRGGENKGSAGGNQDTVASATMPSGSDAAAAGLAAQGQATAAAVAAQSVDVEAVLTDMEGKGGQKLNWRTSIVDLMKLLGLDSSLDARKSLATELGYSGAKDGSAEMNTWLIKAVMKKLAENGGKVPAELRD